MAEMDPNPQYKLHFPFNYENAKWSLSNQASIKTVFLWFPMEPFLCKNTYGDDRIFKKNSTATKYIKYTTIKLLFLPCLQLAQFIRYTALCEFQDFFCNQIYVYNLVKTIIYWTELRGFHLKNYGTWNSRK